VGAKDTWNSDLRRVPAPAAVMSLGVVARDDGPSYTAQLGTAQCPHIHRELLMPFETIVIIVVIVLIVLFVLGYFGRGRLRG
jgi:hypothetical protein